MLDKNIGTIKQHHQTADAKRKREEKIEENPYNTLKQLDSIELCFVV